MLPASGSTSNANTLLHASDRPTVRQSVRPCQQQRWRPSEETIFHRLAVVPTGRPDDWWCAPTALGRLTGRVGPPAELASRSSVSVSTPPTCTNAGTIGPRMGGSARGPGYGVTASRGERLPRDPRRRDGMSDNGETMSLQGGTARRNEDLLSLPGHHRGTKQVGMVLS